MALINCHECGKQVSTESKKCPSCGATVKIPKKPASKLLVYLLGIGVIGSVGVGLMNSSARYDEAKAEEARVAAMTPEQRAQRQAAQSLSAARAASAAKAKEAEDAVAKALLHDVGMAEVTCRMEAEKSAKDPSSVDWIRDEKQFSYTASNKTKALSLQAMRAKNSFGAITKSVVRCELVKSGDNWNVKRMTEKS